jgi:aromatic-amino-acid transaminase
MLRALPVDEFVAYAPISGLAPYLEAVLDDVLRDRPSLRSSAIAVATPGGSGALRHTVSQFLERGQSALTTSFYWSPYATIADENDRKLSTFEMFVPGRTDALHAAALDARMGELASSQGRILLVVNDPCHNPCGYSMTAEDWSNVVEVVRKHAKRVPVTVLLDAAYSTYSPTGLDTPLAALEQIAEDALVLLAFSGSKAFTYYGMRVGALLAVVRDPLERKQVEAALGYACRGTWSNCNRSGMAAVARMLKDGDLSRAVLTERGELTRLLGHRVEAFNQAARRAGLEYPRYDGGFFVTVFAKDAFGTAEAMKRDGVYVVPQPGALRVALCAVPQSVIPDLVNSLANNVR